eukprot:6172643-Pleurochrysis_carterae.AAC.2
MMHNSASEHTEPVTCHNMQPHEWNGESDMREELGELTRVWMLRSAARAAGTGAEASRRTAPRLAAPPPCSHAAGMAQYQVPSF